MEIAGIAPDLVVRIERETSELLGDLIRIDTSNPPGDETAVATYLDQYFRRLGLRGEMVGEPAARRSFVVTLPGTRPGPRLALMAHEDVVPASPEQWHEPPFAGVIENGYVWGRGAIDVKNLLAAFCVVLRRLVEDGRDFAGEVVFVAEADEEDGAVGGARWLVTQRPDLVRCDYLLNEGGGEFMVLPGGERLYELHVGEKGTAQFRVVVSGDSGHASVPLRHGNAVVGVADVVRALHDYQPAVSLETVPRDYVELLVADTALRARLLDEGEAAVALAELGERDRRAHGLLAPLYGPTFSPTILASSGEAVNVFPESAVVTVDCRMPVGWDEERVAAEIEDRPGRGRCPLEYRVARHDRGQRLAGRHAHAQRHHRRRLAPGAGRPRGGAALRRFHRRQLVPGGLSRHRGLQLRALPGRRRRGDLAALPQRRRAYRRARPRLSVGFRLRARAGAAGLAPLKRPTRRARRRSGAGALPRSRRCPGPGAPRRAGWNSCRRRRTTGRSSVRAWG